MRKIISRSTTGLLFACALVTIGALQAQAAVINAAGAARLKKLVTADVQWREDMTKVLGSGLTLNGDISVTPEKDFYAVTLPHLVQLVGQKGRVEIGTVVLHAVPGDTADSWKIDGALPSSMTFIDDKNVPQARIDIGEQHFSGTWVPSTDLFPKFKAVFKNIELSTIGKEKLAITIAEASSLIDLKKNASGNDWNGNANFNISDITIQSPGNPPFTLKIAKAYSDSVYDKLDVKHASDLKAAMQAAMKEHMPQTQQEKVEFISKFLLSPPITANGILSKLEFNDLSVHIAATKEEPSQQFSVRRLSIAAGSQDTEQKKSRVRITASVSGLNGALPASPAADFVPRDLNLDVTLGNLPLKDIREIFLGSIQKLATLQPGDTVGRQAATAEMRARELMLPGLIERAGTTFSVKDTYAQNRNLALRLDGNIYANPVTAYGAVGKMTLSIVGLDSMIQKMKKEALKPDSDPQLLVFLGDMVSLQKKGIAVKTGGQTALAYVVELTKDGSVLLNGKTIRQSAASQLGMTEQPEQSAPQTNQKTPAPQDQTSPLFQTPSQNYTFQYRQPALP